VKNYLTLTEMIDLNEPTRPHFSKFRAN